MLFDEAIGFLLRFVEKIRFFSTSHKAFTFPINGYWTSNTKTGITLFSVP